MTFQMYPLFTMTILLCVGKALGCSQKNTSCKDIKTAEGFKYFHGGPEGSEIYVYYNKTLIAHAVLASQSFKCLPEVMSMNNHSVILRDCQDLQVKYYVREGERHVKEICWNYKTTAENQDPKDLPTPWRYNMFVLYCVIALIVIIGIIGIIGMLCLYLPWKRELRKQHNTAEVSQLSFLRYLQTSSCLRKVISQPETGQAEEPRLSDKPSPTGSQDDIEEDDTLESVHVHSIDLKADGEAPQSLSLHCNLSKEGIQLSKNGHTSTPDANSAYDHRAMHRNLGDDPRGVIDNKGKDIVKILEVRGGRTLGDGGPEDHEIEGQPLLSAIQHFDMKGEAAALVNRRGQDPDPVSRGSTAPDTDVESTPNMKN